MNIKSDEIVLAVIAVLSFVFAYLYDKWKYNTMWERCQASDMADSETYAFVNHHSSLDFMLEGVCLALILWIIVKVIATITRKNEVNTFPLMKQFINIFADVLQKLMNCKSRYTLEKHISKLLKNKLIALDDYSFTFKTL